LENKEKILELYKYSLEAFSSPSKDWAAPSIYHAKYTGWDSLFKLEDLADVTWDIVPEETRGLLSTRMEIIRVKITPKFYEGLVKRLTNEKTLLYIARLWSENPVAFEKIYANKSSSIKATADSVESNFYHDIFTERLYNKHDGIEYVQALVLNTRRLSQTPPIGTFGDFWAKTYESLILK
jgi:hypothetical protein